MWRLHNLRKELGHVRSHTSESPARSSRWGDPVGPRSASDGDDPWMDREKIRLSPVRVSPWVVFCSCFREHRLLKRISLDVADVACKLEFSNL